MEHELDHKEGWALKNWCFQTVVLEKTLESPLYCKEIKLDNPKGNQSWIFIERTDAKNWLIWKDPDAGKDQRQEEEGTTKDNMVGWHHQLNGLQLGKLWEFLMDRETWRAVVHGVVKSRT